MFTVAFPLSAGKIMMFSSFFRFSDCLEKGAYVEFSVDPGDVLTQTFHIWD